MTASGSARLPSRGVPLVLVPATDDTAALRSAYEATRALLHVRDAAGAIGVLRRFVTAVGGSTVPAHLDDGSAIPLDLTFGEEDPLLPVADPASDARMHLERFLPPLVEDARAAVEATRGRDRLAADAAVDALTGMLNRRMIVRRLGRAAPGDRVALLDLAHFKRVNDEHGHDVGDAVLRSFGRVVLDQVRAGDACGRIGGEEFVVLFPGTTTEDARAALERLRSAWRDRRPLPVGISAGLAAVGAAGGREALRHADAALYAAKRGGRDRVEVAEDA